MAKKSGNDIRRPNNNNRKKKRTSIGRSKNSRPKHKRANKSKYRGQGK